VVHHIADRIGVMYLGELVELGDSSGVYNSPRHPYTEALLSAIPVIDADAEARERIVLTGDLPNPIDKPTGCAFHPRCRYAQDLCRTEKPLLQIQTDGRQVACHYPVSPPVTVAVDQPAGTPLPDWNGNGMWLDSSNSTHSEPGIRSWIEPTMSGVASS
jgi:oligopeptide/dipeptide ABC transporter ATP-binding protein